MKKMYINELKLCNFRTYSNLDILFSNGINIIYGNNGIGKTNILEAIYMTSITKSYRAQKECECIAFEKEYARISADFVNENISQNSQSVELFISSDLKKQLKDNGIVQKKYSDFIGKYPIVMFSPGDMQIVKGAPKERRRFLDILISQISKKYLMCLSEYNKTLQIKNAYLRKEKIDMAYLKILNEKLASLIYIIKKTRIEYILKLNKYVSDVQDVLSSGKEILELKYASDFDERFGSINSQEEILNFLNKFIEMDISKKSASKSITHDDIKIFVNGKEVALFGSQGQARTALLSLLIAQIKILCDEKQTAPIVLLDDVFSELDELRINYLLEYIKNYQVIITTTDIKNIKLKDVKFFDVETLVKK